MKDPIKSLSKYLKVPVHKVEKEIADNIKDEEKLITSTSVSYTHLRAHET